MPDGIVLSEQDRAKLDGIVQKMIANKESEDNIRFVVDDFKNKYGLKKKESSEPTSQKGAVVSPTKPIQQSTSSDTEPPTRAQASVALGGPTKLFGQEQQQRPTSIMYGDGLKSEAFVPPSTPIDAKPKKYYRVVADERKNVQSAITTLEDKNLKLGRSLEEIQNDGTYQYLQKKKQQLDEEFRPAALAIKEVKKDAAFGTGIIERLISSATEGKYSYLSTETIKLDKDVEDKLIDLYDNAPEEIKQKWYKGALPLEKKEELINAAKTDVLNTNYKKLKEENKYFLTNIKDNTAISQEEKIVAYNILKAKNEAFDAKVASEFADDMLKDNFKATTKSKDLDEAIMSRYEGFLPEQVDVVSTFLEGMGQVAAKVETGIPEMILMGGERFNQLIGTSDKDNYTPIEATLDLINDTTNLNFLPSSKIEKGKIVTEGGDFNINLYSVEKSLANTLPFTLKIMNDVKKGRIEGAPQSMISQLVNPKYNKGFADRLRVVETAYKATIGDNYRDAKDMGMDDSKAYTYANVLSLAEGVSENIMPDFKYFDSLTGATLKNAFKGSLKSAATKQAAKNVTKDFFKNVALELGEEEFVLAVEDGLKYSLLLNHKNSEFFNLKRQKELLAATVIMSGGMGVVGAPGKFTENRNDIYREVYNNIDNLQDSFNAEINSPLNDEKTKQTFRDAYKFASDVSNAIAKAPENVTADQVDLLVQKNKLEEKKKTIDAAFHSDINEEIAGIDAKIRDLAKTPAAEEMSVNAPAVEVTEEKIDNRPIAERQAETESKIKNKNLFIGVGDFSKQLGDSDKEAVPISVGENKGIEIVEYAHPDTGSVDVIATGKTDNDFVGFYRIYENGKPTNKWSSKFENQSRNKEDFKTMISGVQALLPEGHEYTEKTSISTDGLRVWEQQLNKGYELQYDEKGNVITNQVAINGDAIVNELGVDVNKGSFENIKITKEQFETVKKALLPYLEKLGLNESNIRYAGENVKIPGVKASVQIDLPVLRKTKQEAKPTEAKAPSEIETTLDEVIAPASSNIKEQIARAKKAISKFLPNVEIVYHTTAESFQSVVGDNSRGYYDTGTKKIHINGSNANSRTVAHEVFHAVVLKYIASDKQATVLTNRMFKALAKSIKNNPNLLKDINKFAESYSKGLQSEEKLAEVLGYLASEYETLPDVSKNIIQKWLENIAKMLGIKKFTDQEVVDFMNTLATKVAYGQEITEGDVKAINQGLSVNIGSPVNLFRNQKGTKIEFTDSPKKLSFVTNSDKIDINKLIDDIIKNDQSVWFWMADQLGRGNYYDEVIDGEHYLDAGPSFALDPKNRDNGVLWASGLAKKTLQSQIDKTDYIFFISGSPERSKLFNRRVLDLVAERINKNSNFNDFKKSINEFEKETAELTIIKDALNNVNSFDELAKSTKRKPFLIAIGDVSKKKTSPKGSLKELLNSFNAFVDYNELRDGFYKENGFTQNDIMLVGRPTGLGDKAEHSTYETEILGEVIGVPDKKINSWDIMPEEIKEKYKKIISGKEEKTKAIQNKIIAGETGIVRKIKSRKQISPENSSNYANMTEDGKGNFVFYHFGPRGIKAIDPKKYGSNKGAITSKPEIAAMGRVGGMSQFYTMPEYQESNVSGDKYMIKVPMDKVYDFNTDPENFYDRAKEMFKAKHPDLPFTANDQLAYITKLAEKSGYDMTVAEWNDMSRAQSTKALKPMDTQVMDGNVISKPFKEDYESNSSKGFVAEVPTSKEAKLKDVYQKINAERNAKNRYDSLYSLAEDFPKLSQDKITDMIESSDISKEMKDAYAEALAYEPGTRMSGRRQVDAKAIAKNTKAEVDRVKALPINAEDGATFNLDGTKYEGGGLVVPMNSLEGNTTQEKISSDMIGDFAKENEDSVGDESMVKMGIYKFPDSDTMSIDMNIVIPNEHRAVALEFGKLIGQESLFDLDTFENVKTGGDGLNPMKLTAEQFREAASSLKNGVMPTFVSGRRQKSPIDTAVETAKRRGFNDKDIADYLVGKGYTRAQATNAILRYNNVTAAKLRKEDSVFTKDGRNKIVTFLDQVKRRALSAKSFLPKSVFLAKDKIESNIKAEAKRASYLVDDFNRLIKNYKGDIDVLHDEFDKYLRGDQTAVLPDEFKAVAGKMRMHIDNLSQMLLRTGAVSVSQAETIAANLGQYINRSYQVFDKKDWAKQVKDEMKEAARVDLRNMYRAEAESKAKQTGMDADIILEDFINKKIDELISGEDAATFLGISKTGAKNLGIMKERLDIPLSIRQLMGEYTDASQNYARTVLKIATLAENARFLQSARESGMGVFFFNENDPNRPKEFNTKIAGDNSDTMSPLNGLYTTPEIAKAFAQKIGTGDAIEAALGTELGPVVRGVYETYMKALSSVKWLKTIGSVATHAKNVTGNVWFMLSNGYYNPKKYAEAFSVLKNSSKEEFRDKLDEYIRAGIIDQSAALGEIKAMFADADFETAIENRLKKNQFQKVKAGVKKVGQKMTTAYQLEDDFFKIISYESEKARYSKASFDKPFNELTTEEQNIIKEKASEITKNVLPNYARIPGLVKLLKAVPVTGTFVSFQAEAYRTAWNTVALAADELRSDNKKIKAIGALRLSGIAMSQAAKFGLMALMGTIVSGGDDDDDDELKKNTKLFVAPWSKDSDLVLVDYGNGKMSYIDFSASDPHGGIKKAYNSVMAGKDITESFTNGLTQLLEPFMKEDMLLNVITDIKDNKNAYGGKLYNESDTDVNKINAIMGRVYKAFEPGTITSVRKVVGSDDIRNELAGQLTGYKINTVDVNNQLGFKMNELKDLSGGAKSLYSSAFYKFEDGTITGDDLDKTYEQANKSQKEVYEKMMKYMNAASFFGVEDYMIEDNMQGVGKSVINDLWYGEAPDMKMKEVEE
jgi:23S rRNA pseudoU1915 N3-methylase RlmH